MFVGYIMGGHGGAVGTSSAENSRRHEESKFLDNFIHHEITENKTQQNMQKRRAPTVDFSAQIYRKHIRDNYCRKD